MTEPESHRPGNLYVAIDQAERTRQEADLALAQLRAQLKANASKIASLAAELEVTQAQLDHYAYSLPLVERQKLRADKHLNVLRERAEKVEKELRAEKRLQEYLQELQKDDEDSERRLKEYLSELLARDTDEDSDSDSEASEPWKVLPSSTTSNLQPNISACNEPSLADAEMLDIGQSSLGLSLGAETPVASGTIESPAQSRPKLPPNSNRPQDSPQAVGTPRLSPPHTPPESLPSAPSIYSPTLNEKLHSPQQILRPMHTSPTQEGGSATPAQGNPTRSPSNPTPSGSQNSSPTPVAQFMEEGPVTTQLLHSEAGSEVARRPPPLQSPRVTPPETPCLSSQVRKTNVPRPLPEVSTSVTSHGSPAVYPAPISPSERPQPSACDPYPVNEAGEYPQDMSPNSYPANSDGTGDVVAPESIRQHEVDDSEEYPPQETLGSPSSSHSSLPQNSDSDVEQEISNSVAAPSQNLATPNRSPLSSPNGSPSTLATAKELDGSDDEDYSGSEPQEDQIQTVESRHLSASVAHSAAQLQATEGLGDGQREAGSDEEEEVEYGGDDEDGVVGGDEVESEGEDEDEDEDECDDEKGDQRESEDEEEVERVEETAFIDDDEENEEDETEEGITGTQEIVEEDIRQSRGDEGSTGEDDVESSVDEPAETEPAPSSSEAGGPSPEITTSSLPPPAPLIVDHLPTMPAPTSLPSTPPEAPARPSDDCEDSVLVKDSNSSKRIPSYHAVGPSTTVKPAIFKAESSKLNPVVTLSKSSVKSGPVHVYPPKPPQGSYAPPGPRGIGAYSPRHLISVLRKRHKPVPRQGGSGPTAMRDRAQPEQMVSPDDNQLVIVSYPSSLP